MNICSQFRCALILVLLLASCKTGPVDYSDAQFHYIVQPRDTLDSIVSVYQNRGVDVWAGAILMANRSLNATNLVPSTTIIIPARNCITPRLSEPIEFNGFTVSRISSPEAAKRLMTQQLKSSGNNPEQTNLAYAATTHDMADEDYLRTVRDKLGFMAKAQSSIHSYLIGEYLKDLPVTALESCGNTLDSETYDSITKKLEADTQRSKTLRDYKKRGAPIRVIDLAFRAGVLELEAVVNKQGEDIHSWMYFKEIGLGDFDFDGYEDALLEVIWKSEGTMATKFTAMVTKTGPKDGLKFIYSDVAK